MFTDGVLTSVGTHTYVTVGRGGLSTFRGSKFRPMFKKQNKTNAMQILNQVQFT